MGAHTLGQCRTIPWTDAAELLVPTLTCPLKQQLLLMNTAAPPHCKNQWSLKKVKAMGKNKQPDLILKYTRYRHIYILLLAGFKLRVNARLIVVSAVWLLAN